MSDEEVALPEDEENSERDFSSDDKLWAALGYPIGLIAIIALLMEDKKDRPFIRYHAVQAIAFNVVMWILIFLFSGITLGIGALCSPVLWLVSLWPAYDAYQGNYTEIPVITNFIKKQGWV